MAKSRARKGSKPASSSQPAPAPRPPVAAQARSTPAVLVRPSWGTVADAVGHCMLVFAYAPALLSIPSWLWIEFNNAANLRLPVVLVFAPMRGFLLWLDAFQLGAVSGALAGCLQGLLLSAWRRTDESVSTRQQRLALGALSGALAASLVVTVRVLPPILRGTSITPVRQIVSEIVSGMVCGLLSTSTALRLLTPAADNATPARSPA